MTIQRNETIFMDTGALLRREGLYSFHLSSWREARQNQKKQTVEAKEVECLHRENAKLRERLLWAETVIEVQRKVSDLLGVDLNQSENDEND